MYRKNGRARKLGRPAPQARRVFEDWIRGVHVYGWEYSHGEYSYLTFTSCFSGGVVATRTLPRDWWEGLDPMRKHEVEKSLVEKALASRGPQGAGVRAHDADLAGTCPVLHEFLTLTQLPDGRVRQTSSLLVFVEGQVFKAVLNERDTELALWATSESLQGLFAELEARLNAPIVDWRPQKRQSAPAGGKGVDGRRSGR